MLEENEFKGLYFFAHRILPQEAFHSPEDVLDSIAAEGDCEECRPSSLLFRLWWLAAVEGLYYDEAENRGLQTEEDWETFSREFDEILENQDHPLMMIYSRLGREIRSRIVQIMGQRCALIFPPRPRRMPEAYLVAFFKDPQHPDEKSYRYFTLEKTEPQRPQGDGVLCEWFADRSRVNYGLLSSEDPQRFIQLITDVLRRRQNSL